MNQNKEYKSIWLDALLIGAGIVLLFVALSSCRITKSGKSEINSKDSIEKTSQGSVRVDSSGTKTKETYTKETFIPVFDTTNNHFTFNMPASKPQYIYIKETGDKQTEQAQIIKDTSWQEAFRQLSTLIASKETESKTRVGLGFWEIFAIGVVGLIFLFLVANRFITLKR
jgi:hypothetical protein